MRAWGIIFALLLTLSGCATPAGPVSTSELERWLPFIEDGTTTLGEVRSRLGSPEWREMHGQVYGYEMTRESGQPLQRHWRSGKNDSYYLVVLFSDTKRVRAHSLVLVQRDGKHARLRRDDVEPLPAELSLGEVLLRFGPPHQKEKQVGPRPESAHDGVSQRLSGAGFVVYGWGNTGPTEYKQDIGNQAGGYLVLQIGSDFTVRRRYLVDRHRWEDNITRGVQQTKKYWRFLDEHQPPNG